MYTERTYGSRRVDYERMVAVSAKRSVEIFSASCPLCDELVQKIEQAACPSCDVVVLDMNDVAVAERAKRLGVRSLPSVAIDGELASCCHEGGPDLEVLRRAGLGEAI